METRKRRGSRSGVFRLNAGATSFGRRTSLPLNSPGGSFMAGRPSGGGAGAGDTLARALSMSAPAQSVQGLSEAFSVGPPPVAQSFSAPSAPATGVFSMPQLPSFSPPSISSQVSTLVPHSFLPSFQPVVQQPLPKRVRYI